MIENKEMLLYSMNKSFEEAINALNSENQMKVYFRVGTSLQWIVACYDRIASTNLSVEEKSFKKALHGVNNALKHRAEFIVFHRKTGAASYPRKYPYKYGFYYAWSNIEYVELNHKDQKEEYTKQFEGRKINDTLCKAKEIVERHYRKE